MVRTCQLTKCDNPFYRGGYCQPHYSRLRRYGNLDYEPAMRGFNALDPEARRLIASKGGKASGGNFKNNPKHAREAGRKGGKASWIYKEATNE